MIFYSSNDDGAGTGFATSKISYRTHRSIIKYHYIYVQDTVNAYVIQQRVNNQTIRFTRHRGI